jgi:hypothetical protein
MGCGFLYFVSGDERPPTLDKLRKWGLGYAFSKSPEHRPINSNSPSGKPGGVIAEPERHQGKVAGYHKAEQTWRKLPIVEGRPEIWVGYWNDAKPTPADLVRAPLLPGAVSMRLGDGEHWLIATLTEFDAETKSGECTLPAPLDYDEYGNLFTTRPVGEYGELWDAVHPVAMGICFGSNEPDSDIKEPTEQEIRKAAFRLLQANYVVDMPELVALGCLQNDSTFRTIVIASCRGEWLMDAIRDVAKKNEPQPAANISDTTGGKAA